MIRRLHSMLANTSPGRTLLALLLIITIWITAGRPGPQPAHGEATVSAKNKKSSTRVREGVRIKGETGEFKVRGDRATFVTQNGQAFDGLENLNLERIVRVIADNHRSLQWSVSGLVTEYRGTNYLLVTHAVLKSRGDSANQAPAAETLRPLADRLPSEPVPNGSAGRGQ